MSYTMIRKDHCKVRGLARSTGSDYQYFCFSKRIYRGGGDDIERLPIEISLPETHKSGKNIKSYIRQKHESRLCGSPRSHKITGQKNPRDHRPKETTQTTAAAREVRACARSCLAGEAARSGELLKAMHKSGKNINPSNA